jgi:outer membrane protein
LTPRQALRALLVHSNLQVSRGANGVFVIKPRALVATAPAPAPAPRPEPAATAPPAASAPQSARESAGPWLLGASAVYSSDAGHARSGATLALNAEYFITDHVAAALDMTVPRTHSFDGGSARLQSSTVRLNYHFLPESTWDPYLGAGVNVTAIYEVKGVATLDHMTAGPSVEAGFDVRLNPHWLLSAAVSWAQVQPAASGLQGHDIRLDPVQFGLGFDYRF